MHETSVPLTPEYSSIKICECAFLRVKEDANGAPVELKCLLKRGQECSRAAEHPCGLACQDAVRRSKRRKETDKNYWDSVRRHHLKQSEKARERHMHHGRQSNAFSSLGTAKQEFMFCKRKKRYSDQKQAEENRKWCEAKRGISLRVMYCPYCNGFHLTKKYAEQNRLFSDNSRTVAVRREMEAREETRNLNWQARHAT